MYTRLLKLSKSNSFFLFGPRGTGKSTLLNNLFSENPSLFVLTFDLLDPSIEAPLTKSPERLIEIVNASEKKIDWIFIDEIQKIPKLLDVVHKIIFEKKIKFALTGSSARKLRRDSANLLAGRAFSFYLFPLSYLELGKDFNLEKSLEYGQLPGVVAFKENLDKKRFLISYVQTYIKEEILVEQLVRNIDPFRSFLEIAAQANTEIINYTNIARDAGTNSKNVERYFEILNDTLLGFFLEPYTKSVRVRQKKSPKFYFFDCGVVRTLSNEINQNLLPQTFSYGNLFEQFIIVEIYRLNHYFEKNWKLYYIRTGSDLEIDLIIEKSKNDFILIEIKSTTRITDAHLNSLKTLGSEFKNAKKYIFCQEKTSRLIGEILVMNWKIGINKIFE